MITEEIKNEMDYKFLTERDEIINQYNDFFFKKTIFDLTDNLINQLLELKEKEYSKYYLSYKNNEPYLSRVNTHSKVKSINDFITKLETYKKQFQGSLKELIRYGDKQRIEECGFTKFVQLYCWSY